MANVNQVPPIPSQPAPVNIQSIVDIIHSLQLKVHGQSSKDQSLTFACIPDPNENIPECDKKKILDPGPIRARLLVILNKCHGSASWTQYTYRLLSEPRGKSGVWAVRSLDKDKGQGEVNKNVCAS